MAKKVTKTENTEFKSNDLENVNVVVENEPKKDNEVIIPYTSHDIFELNQKITAIETLISYHINIAKANDGYYEHDCVKLYQEAKSKISKLEFQKNKIIKQLENIILGNVKENMD